MQSDFSQLERSLGYQFRQPELLVLALRHRSVSGRQNNERLEFLGDSILNFVIGFSLFDRFPKAREGQLSRLRATLVKGSTLAKVAHQLGLGDYLELGPGELKSGGARRDSILADAVEALIGALYLDGGMELCQRLVLQWYQQRLSGLSLDDTVKDNKTRLQEWLQSRKLPLPDYGIIEIKGHSHAQHFVVSCTVQEVELSFTGEGQSRRQAEQQAAGKMIAALQTEGAADD